MTVQKILRAIGGFFYRLYGFGLDALDLLDEGLEGLVVADGELGKDLAVEFHLLRFERPDERAVARVEGTQSVAKADDPEGPEGALLVAAVTIGVCTGFHDGLLGQVILATSAPAIALGGIEEVVASFAGGNATLYTGHNVRVYGWIFDYGTEEPTESQGVIRLLRVGEGVLHVLLFLRKFESLVEPFRTGLGARVTRVVMVLARRTAHELATAGDPNLLADGLFRLLLHSNTFNLFNKTRRCST